MGSIYSERYDIFMELIRIYDLQKLATKFKGHHS